MQIRRESTKSLSKEARTELERIPQPGQWKVERARPGFTYRGAAILLVRLRKEDEPRNSETRHLFVSLDPRTGKVTAVRTLDHDRKHFSLGHLFELGPEFSVLLGHRSKGIGSTVTAEAIHFALGKGGGIGVGSVDNQKWRKWYARIGFRYQLVQGEDFIQHLMRLSESEAKELFSQTPRPYARYLLRATPPE